MVDYHADTKKRQTARDRRSTVGRETLPPYSTLFAPPRWIALPWWGQACIVIVGEHRMCHRNIASGPQIRGTSPSCTVLHRFDSPSCCVDCAADSLPPPPERPPCALLPGLIRTDNVSVGSCDGAFQVAVWVTPSDT